MASNLPKIDLQNKGKKQVFGIHAAKTMLAILTPP